MSLAEERRRDAAERRAKLAKVVPERGFFGWVDRGAWAAMAQDDPAEFSWPKALVTIVAGIGLALVIYATFFPSIAFVVGLAAAYGFLLVRALVVHWRFAHSQGGGG